MRGFLGVFATCEEDFVSLIDGMYPTDKPADASARDSMQLEAQNVFLAVDDLYQVCAGVGSGRGGVDLSRMEQYSCHWISSETIGWYYSPCIAC